MFALEFICLKANIFNVHSSPWSPAEWVQLIHPESGFKIYCSPTIESMISRHVDDDGGGGDYARIIWAGNLKQNHDVKTIDALSPFAHS